MKIEDGTGSQRTARVTSDNRLLVSSTTNDPRQSAALHELAFNINTGPIALSTNGDNALLYFENNEPPTNGESRYYVETLVIGIGDFNGATLTQEAEIKVFLNSTGGTIISGATDVDMAVNNDGGVTTGFDTSTKVYKGADGNTLTGGTQWGLIYGGISTTLGAVNRVAVDVNLVIRRGGNIGVTVDPNTSAGSGNVYVALLGYRVNPEHDYDY